MNNIFYVAAAGSGKTTFIIDEAITRKETVLILTYTIENKNEIQRKVIIKLGYIPPNIDVQTWFDFLLSNGVRPYQGLMHEGLYDKHIGFILTNEISGLKYRMKDGTPIYYGEADFFRHYFTKDLKIYSDKISKFIVNSNKISGGKIIERLVKIYKYVFIDETQDLAGYDLDIIKLLFRSKCEVILVGDPRQTIYRTHPTRKYQKYQDGNIVEFFEKELTKSESCKIDMTSLAASHRNNQIIADFSSKLHPRLPKTIACNCSSCRTSKSDHIGIFLVNKNDIDSYLMMFNATQLRWDKTIAYNQNYQVYNFGESKGLTFDHVLIYPTEDMIKWVKKQISIKSKSTVAKFYVAITRSRYSVGIVLNYNESDKSPNGYYFNNPLLLAYNH
jgi:DNA helicase-2/ATP-dependent DNA helicase PcrA